MKKVIIGIASLLAFSLAATLLSFWLIFRPTELNKEYIASMSNGNGVVELQIDKIENTLQISQRGSASSQYNNRGQGNMVFFLQSALWSTYENTDSNLHITGWALIEGEDIKTPCPKVVLHDVEQDKYYSLYTEVQIREDVAQAIDGEYKMAGFRGSTPIKWLPTGHCYEIGLLYLSDEHTYFVSSGKTIDL